MKTLVILVLGFCFGLQAEDSSSQQIANLNAQLEGGRKAGLSRYVPTLVENLPIKPDLGSGGGFLEKYHIEKYWDEFQKMGLAEGDLPGGLYDYDFSLPGIAEKAFALGDKALANEAIAQLIRLKRFSEVAVLALKFGDEELAIRAGLTSIAIHFATGYENDVMVGAWCLSKVKGPLRPEATEIIYDLVNFYGSAASMEKRQKLFAYSIEEHTFEFVLRMIEITGDKISKEDKYASNYGPFRKVTDPRGIKAIRDTLSRIKMESIRNDHLVQNVRRSLVAIGDKEKLKELGGVFFERAKGKSRGHFGFYEIASQYFDAAEDRGSQLEVLKAEIADPDFETWYFEIEERLGPLAKELNSRESMVALKKVIEAKVAFYEKQVTPNQQEEQIRLSNLSEWNRCLEAADKVLSGF